MLFIIVFIYFTVKFTNQNDISYYQNYHEAII